MKELVINNINFLQDENNEECFISGIEICKNLGYQFPKEQSSKVWLKYKKELEENSIVTKLATVNGKYYETRCYNEAGTLFFISKCNTLLSNKITKEMINAFIELRKIINNFSPKNITKTEMALMIIESEKQLNEAKKLLEKQQPKIDYYENVINSDGLIDLGTTAKTLNLNIGRTRLFAILRSKGILNRKNVPLQNYIENGYFVTKEKYFDLGYKNTMYIQTFVTSKGLNWLYKVLKNNENIELLKN